MISVAGIDDYHVGLEGEASADSRCAASTRRSTRVIRSAWASPTAGTRRASSNRHAGDRGTAIETGVVQTASHRL